MSKAKERQKLSWENLTYSIRRMDLLIISISGAGVYLCLETLKYLRDNCMLGSSWVKISGVFFVITIIVNFVSQMFGYESNKYDFLMSQVEIDSDDAPTEDDILEKDKYDRKSEKYSKITKKLNYASISTMFLGLLCIIIFFLFIF